MAESSPEIIAINHDDYHAKYIGTTADEKQFFLTTPFIPAIEHEVGRGFLALYLFDMLGQLLDAKIEDLGVRSQMNLEQCRALEQSWLSELGELSFGDIKVAPFRVDRFGIEFGLIPNEPEAEDEFWWVTAEPGDYMAFAPPYDGDYDT